MVAKGWSGLAIGSSAALLLVAALPASADTGPAPNKLPDWTVYEAGTNEVLLTSDDPGATSSSESAAAESGAPSFDGTGVPAEGIQTTTRPAGAWARDLVVDAEPTGIEPAWIVGDDDRVQADETVAPHSQVVALEMTDGENFWTCTGYLYGPNDVATAGHCIDPSGEPSMYIEGRVFFQLGTAGPGDPAEYCVPISHAVNGRWVDDEDPGWDYAALHLNCDAGAQYGYLGTVNDEDIEGNYEATGYPATPPTGPYGTQWSANGPFVNEMSRILQTNVDLTSGQSGGPVWRAHPELGNAAVGINIGQDNRWPDIEWANIAVHIGSGAFGDLMDWRDAG